MARGLPGRARRRSATRSRSPRAATSSSSSDATSSPCIRPRRGRNAGGGPRAGRARGARRAPERRAGRSARDAADEPAVRRAARLRARRHQADGLRRLLPDRRRLHQLGEGAGHPGRARPRLGGGQPRRVGLRITDLDPIEHDAALRALPQSRAQLDARHRRRLLLRAPRRGDPLRAREVRRGSRRADHHVRNAEGEAGDQGRRARARVHVRARPTGSPSSIPTPKQGKDFPLAEGARDGAAAARAARAGEREAAAVRPARSASRACCATPRSTPPASSSRRGR